MQLEMSEFMFFQNAVGLRIEKNGVAVQREMHFVANHLHRSCRRGSKQRRRSPGG